MWTDRRGDRQTAAAETGRHYRGERKTGRATLVEVGGREGGSLTDAKRRTGRQADRQLRRSTGSHTVRLRYPGNGQPISHSQTAEFSSVNLYCPRGIIRKGKQANALGRETERTHRTVRTDRQTDTHEVQRLNALLDTQHTLILLHATLVLS